MPTASAPAGSRDHGAKGLAEAVDAFGAELARQVRAREASLHDPTRLGAEAARWAVARAAPTDALAERIGPVYSSGDLRHWLVPVSHEPLTGEAVRKRAQQRTLVAFRTADRRWVFPEFQFAFVDGRLEPIPGVIALWQTLPHEARLPQLDLIVWMRTPLRDLEGSPEEIARSHGYPHKGIDRAVSRLRARLDGRAA